MGQLGVQYVTGAAWAFAVRPPRQSAANTNARPNLPEKVDIRATAKCPETIRPGYRERQSRQNSREPRGEIADPYLNSSRVIARSGATRQSSFSILSRHGLLRGACHRARIRPARWLAMTA